jgi:hypothetical protein
MDKGVIYICEVPLSNLCRLKAILIEGLCDFFSLSAYLGLALQLSHDRLLPNPFHFCLHLFSRRRDGRVSDTEIVINSPFKIFQTKNLRYSPDSVRTFILSTTLLR